MLLKYKILAVDEADQSLLVRYYSDVSPEEELVSERGPDGSIVRGRCEYALTVYDRSILATEETVHEFIMTQAPLEWLQMKKESKEKEPDMKMPVPKQMVGREVVVDVGDKRHPDTARIPRPVIDVAALVAEVEKK